MGFGEGGDRRVGWGENVWLTGVTFCLLLGCFV